MHTSQAQDYSEDYGLTYCLEHTKFIKILVIIISNIVTLGLRTTQTPTLVLFSRFGMKKPAPERRPILEKLEFIKNLLLSQPQFLP